jgi:hypothetical protein
MDLGQKKSKGVDEVGIVSIWIGKEKVSEALARALDVSFNDEGDFLGSPFSRAFGIKYYGDCTQETRVCEPPPKTLRELLKGVSHEAKIAPALERLPGAKLSGENAVVLLYDIRYDGKQTNWSSDGIQLKNVGSIRYK